MTVGAPGITTRPHAGLSYECMTKSSRGALVSDWPKQPCPVGIFTSHHFPPCWNGKDLDSPDHQSHMYNTVNSEGFPNAPKCPDSHPVRMPQVTFETQWDTSKFNSLWTTGAPNPFVWSFEGMGAGTHADYMFGWKGDALQRAMDKSECFYDGCGAIKKQVMSVANECTVKDMVGEVTDGWIKTLPGMTEKSS